jgi:hypothetical protein
MKKIPLIFVHAAVALVLIIGACSSPVKNKIKGKWRSRDGATKLYITDKDFTLDDGEAIPEDYFVKGDTIFTSFQGNQPYTNFVVQRLTDHYLTLMGPDSVSVEYSRWGGH